MSEHDDALPALPIGEAEVLWHEPDPVMPERPGKIIDASHAFMDAAPLGTRLYSAEQMRAYARQAVALWKLSAMAQEDERAAPPALHETHDPAHSSETDTAKATHGPSAERPPNKREDAADSVAAGRGDALHEAARLALDALVALVPRFSTPT